MFCALCNDFVYDADLDFTIFVESNNALAHMQRMTRMIVLQPVSAPLTLPPLGLPGPMQYSEWRPTKVDAATIAKFSRRPTVPSYQLGAPITDLSYSLCLLCAQINDLQRCRLTPRCRSSGSAQPRQHLFHELYIAGLPSQSSPPVRVPIELAMRISSPFLTLLLQ